MVSDKDIIRGIEEDETIRKLYASGAKATALFKAVEKAIAETRKQVIDEAKEEVKNYFEQFGVLYEANDNLFKRLETLKSNKDSETEANKTRKELSENPKLMEEYENIVEEYDEKAGGK